MYMHIAMYNVYKLWIQMTENRMDLPNFVCLFVCHVVPVMSLAWLILWNFLFFTKSLLCPCGWGWETNKTKQKVKGDQEKLKLGVLSHTFIA